ncbi:nitrate- and nitrite sensing domain-containing protein [Streptomyces sp. NBC_00102]|uniref:nitrate- and nitrite sensing domain-containing protein n=1 Tax=Streptomyces sp. NBC_00102 TaxID=2975652 RepID=UPI002257063D|nr:nitrate- and nitrite sensing domain-containing protein [Streptomyces sp. NBC_00102]MCX5400403.1 nitrate- and nitrite sensing domain-containing protein [Streptomyces sp. NBC_00102]
MSLRTALLILAIVPGVALAALWAVTSGQTLLDFQRQAAQGQLAQKAGQPSNIVYYNLQEERRLSAEALADPDASKEALQRQRKLTDKAIATFQSVSDISADSAPATVREAVGKARESINQLPAQRTLVDQGDDEQQAVVYGYYTDLIEVDLQLFSALSQVDNGEVTTASAPLVDLFWVKEMASRSDALLARGWPDGKLSTADLAQLREEITGQSFQYSTKVLPNLPADERAMWNKMADGEAWKTKTKLEAQILAPRDADSKGYVRIVASEKSWRSTMDQVTPQLVALLEHRTSLVVSIGKDSIVSLLVKMVITTVVGLLAVIAVILTTWRLTRNLRRRIKRLQDHAEELERTLPDVVERLGQGEKIDVEAEARAIESDREDKSGDELTRLGAALNLARTSALAAAVRQADQHRGFERLLQRIARRTQQLIGQQLKKLDELERKHEDPEVLDGLFDLDHLTARLRRYEENLVILAGGAPHRRWRKPVPLLDVMRSAQGEVQDYQRVVLDLDGTPWLSERAVGPVSHVLAELIENALAFSRPPSPVEVRAAKVSRGLAIEVEDRGLGMEEHQLAEANELMTRPPRMDVLAHSEDIRLGLHVISRLAHQHGLRVEFRSSAFGGTRVVVLVPDELTVAHPTGRSVSAVPAAAVPAPEPVREEVPASTGALPSRVQGRAMAGVTALVDHAAARSQRSEPSALSEERPPAAADTDRPVQSGTYTVPETPYSGPSEPYGQERYPDTSYAPAQESYGTAEDSYGPGAPSYGSPPDPYAPEDQGYAPAEQPYMTAAGQYPVPDLGFPEQDAPAGAYPAPESDFPDASFAEPSFAEPSYQEPYQEQPYTGTGGFPGPETSPYGHHTHGGERQPEVSGHPALPPGGDAQAPGSEPPLPRRVRQASLVDELRVDPAAGRPAAAPRTPSWDENPLLRPAPRRAGAAIGAFQRRSREARSADGAPAQPTTPPSPLNPREERS